MVKSLLFAASALGLTVIAAAMPLEQRDATFNAKCNNNVVVYWGQDSAANGDLPIQGPLRNYCDGSSDIIVMAFLTTFHDSTGYPVINFANQCDPTSAFPGTNLLHCPQIASDIKYCQSQGKIILLSLGGWTSTTDAPDATTFADQLWDLFGEGSSQHKPFDDALIDGFDWDIEHEPGVDIVAVANALHKHYKSGSKKYYMSAAPFCSGLSTQPYNQKFLESVYLDFIWPQFYNDWCSNAYYGSTPSAGQFYMNFIDWNKWATGGGNPNPNVKLYVGAIAGDHAGNPNDFVGTQKTTEELSGLQKQFPGSFGGAMYWDASYAYDESPNYAALAKSAMAGGASCKSSGRPPKITTTTTDFQTTTTTTKGHKTKTTDVVTTTTEIGTTSTPPTTTTSSVSGGPTPSVGQCSDSNNGQAVCSSPGTAASYQQCVNGNWLARQCGPGTVCVQNGSSSISCGFVSGKNVKGNNVIVKENVTKKKGKSKHNQYYSPLEKLPQFPPNQKYRPM